MAQLTFVPNPPRDTAGTHVAAEKSRKRSWRTTREALWRTRVIGVDGEGWDEDEYGRQCYKLIVAASDDGYTSHLYAEHGRLSSEDMLAWLWDLPEGFLTGFSFSYDLAMILLQLPTGRLELLKDRDKRAELQSQPGMRENYVRWRGWWLEWFPGKRFVIRRQYKSRTVWDAFPWHQMSFVEAIKRAGVATPEELDIVVAGKERRGDNEHVLSDELSYAVTECRLLARMQHKLFQTHDDVGLGLSVFDGPGSTAARAMNLHGVRAALGELPTDVEVAAQTSYIGGRFEQTFHGRFPVLYEYDIVSAYPWVTSQLPCLAHGEWSSSLEIAAKDCHAHADVRAASLLHVRWNVRPEHTGCWGPFPVRGKDRMPTWPFQGHAWVWSDEYHAAASWMPGEFEILEAWTFVPSCQHRPFSFVPDYFERRAQWKREKDQREKVFKLVLNSLYGKVCQRVGKRPFHSWVWASMITSGCRARLLEGMRHDPWHVRMVTTDALYSSVPLPLEIGSQLGQWESSEITDVLLVQPGFFTSQEKSRARGIPDRHVDWDALDRVWDAVPDLVARGDYDISKWGTRVMLPRFIGIKKGLHMGEPNVIGKWTEEEAFFAFWSKKRPTQRWTGTHIVSYPPDTPVAGFELKPYNPDMWTYERENEFEVENREADEWTYSD